MWYLQLIVIVILGSGAITKQALGAFYRSVIGLSGTRVDEIIDTAYDRMTSVSITPYFLEGKSYRRTP